MNADELIKKMKSKDRQSDQYWLELEQEVEHFLSSDACEEDKMKVRGGTLGLESLFMICNGIRFEKAKSNLLDAVDKGLKVTNQIEVFGQNLEGLLRKMKEDGLLTDDEQITIEGKRYLKEHKEKPVVL